MGLAAIIPRGLYRALALRAGMWLRWDAKICHGGFPMSDEQLYYMPATEMAARGDLNGAIARYEHISQVMPLTEYVIALGDCYTLAGRSADAQRAYSLVGAL